MIGKWFDHRAYPIGIDFGAGSIKMLQWRRDGSDGPRIRAMASEPLPPDLPPSGPQRVETLAAMIRRMLASHDFVGRKVVSSLPADALQYKNLRLPPMPADELRAAVEWEAADRFQINAVGSSPVHIQFFDAGEVRQGEEDRQEIILLIAPQSAVDEQLATLVAADLKPLAIECVPSALARYVSHGQSMALDPVPRLILEVGHASTKVLIVRAGRVAFFKLVEIGGKQFDASIAESLKMPVSEAEQLRRRLAQPTGEPSGAAPKPEIERAVVEAMRPIVAEVAREIGLCLRYYSVSFRGRRPEEANILGGEAYSPQLCKLLESDAGISLVRGWEGSGEPLGHEWAVAAGLSMRVPQGRNRWLGHSLTKEAA